MRSLLVLLFACREATDPAVHEPTDCTVHADVDGDGFGDPEAWLPGCVPPQGFVLDASDCDDADARVHPGAVETCNDTDDDCNGNVDSGATDEALLYADADGDGFGDDLVTFVSCPEPGRIATGGDCDDTDPDVFPGAVEVCGTPDDDCDGLVDDADPSRVGGSTWHADEDGDSYGDPTADAMLACESPPGSVGDVTDCDDGDAAIHPSADEVCNGIDDDCDTLQDDDDSGVIATERFYQDNDGDGFGSEYGWLLACEQPSDHVTNRDDCDDADPIVGAPLPSYADWDQDGYGADAAAYWCYPGTLFSYTDGDCDNLDAEIHPDALEVCNDLDDNCDGLTDEDDPLLTPLLSYADGDGDGFGDRSSELASCDVPAGYLDHAGDCADDDGAVHPGAPEWCDAIDNDCDGVEDDDVVTLDWYPDADGDGFGVGEPKQSCMILDGYAPAAGDCDDANAIVWPGAPDVCGDDVDEDCDGNVQDCQLSLDLADFTVSGVEDGAGFGWAIGAGDVDADGTMDLLVGAPYVDLVRGQAYVFLGPVSGDLRATDADIVVTAADDDNLGGSFLHRDVNGDGVGDMVVGAFGPGAAGAYVFLGPTDASTDVTLSDALFADGSDVSRAGWATEASDHDDDGSLDLLVGAPYAGTSFAGAVYVVPATKGGTKDLLTDAAYVYEGARPTECFGWSIAAAGDYDADGIADLVVGAPGFLDPSRVYIVPGGNAEGTYAVDTVAIATLVAHGVTDELGKAVASADYDGDGYDDVLAGASGAESSTGWHSGLVYAFLGPLSSRRGTRDADVTWEGPDQGSSFGNRLAVGGSVTGDSSGDLLIGTWFGDASGRSAFLQMGTATGVVEAADLASFGTAVDGTYVGATVAFLPDWSGDGGSEIALGSPQAWDDGEVMTGAAYVVFSEQLY